jgi:hypothetical protein
MLQKVALHPDAISPKQNASAKFFVIRKSDDKVIIPKILFVANKTKIYPL